MHHASLTFYYFTETMLNWCHNWRRNCKSTHRTMSIHLLLTERLSGTSVSTGSQSSYLHLKVFPSVSLHKLLAYSNSMKGKWKMKKYALNIWQRVIKEGQFWELSLWHFLLAFQKAFFFIREISPLSFWSFCIQPLGESKRKRNMFLWIQMNVQDRTIQKRKYLSLYSASGKKPSTKPKRKPHTKKSQPKNSCCWCLNVYIFTCCSPTIFLNFLICKNKIGKSSH